MIQLKYWISNLSRMSTLTLPVNPSLSDKNLYPKRTGSTRISVKCYVSRYKFLVFSLVTGHRSLTTSF